MNQEIGPGDWTRGLEDYSKRLAQKTRRLDQKTGPEE